MRRFLVNAVGTLALAGSAACTLLFPFGGEPTRSDAGSDDFVDASPDAAADAAPDAAADAGCGTDAGTVPLAAPELLAPWNGAFTGSLHSDENHGALQPVLRWAPVANSTSEDLHYEVQVERCLEPAVCRELLEGPGGFSSDPVSVGAQTSYSPSLEVAAEPPVGARYAWRVRACLPCRCADWSTARWMEVGRVRCDIDGDGYSDVVAGSQFSGNTAGEAIAFFGGAGGAMLSESFVLSPDGAEDPASGFGVAIGCGDLNGDGFADAVVGAHLDDVDGVARAGSFFVARGGSRVPTVERFPSPDPSQDGLFALGLDVVGDLDGDTLADLVVTGPERRLYRYHGDPLSSDPRRDEWRAPEADPWFTYRVVGAGDIDGSGRTSFLATTWSTAEGRRATYLLGLEGGALAELAVLADPQGSSCFGYSPGGGADLTGDGFGDAIVGDPGPDGLSRGVTAWFAGSPGGLALGEALAPTELALDQGDGFGSSAAVVGDLDGNGRAEVTSGAAGWEAGEFADGGAVVVFDLQNATQRLLTSPTPANSGLFGSSVAPAGDVNGDGFDDLLVGAQMEPAPDGGTGRVHVFLGRIDFYGRSDPADQTLSSPNPGDSDRFGLSL